MFRNSNHRPATEDWKSSTKANYYSTWYHSAIHTSFLWVQNGAILILFLPKWNG